MNREELAWALLLSVPVGVGVSFGMLKATGGRLSALVFGPGVVTFLVIFLLVVGGLRGSPEQASD